VRQEHIAGGSAQALSHALEDHEERRYLPAPHKRERRHGDQIHGVSEDCDGPVGARAIGEAAGEQPKTRGEHFAKAGDEPDLECIRAEVSEKRPENAARAFVGRVREQAHDTKNGDKANRRGALLLGSRTQMLGCHTRWNRAQRRVALRFSATTRNAPTGPGPIFDAGARTQVSDDDKPRTPLTENEHRKRARGALLVGLAVDENVAVKSALGP
jgi:hypothetical protein